MVPGYAAHAAPICRVAWTGRTTSASPTPIPAQPMRQHAMKGSGVPIAIDRDETRTQGALAVASAFQDDAPLDRRNSSCTEGASPAPAWSPVPGATSYALVVEDPDARPVTPVVHWIAWNIPGTPDRLPEGVQEQLRLTDPDGVLQGRTTHGSVGYDGPHPPVGEPAHHYHFEVFALDAMLDVKPGASRDELLAPAQGP